MKACTANEPLACCEYCALNPRNISGEISDWFEPVVTHFCDKYKLHIDDFSEDDL